MNIGWNQLRYIDSCVAMNYLQIIKNLSTMFIFKDIPPAILSCLHGDGLISIAFKTMMPTLASVNLTREITVGSF